MTEENSIDKIEIDYDSEISNERPDENPTRVIDHMYVLKRLDDNPPSMAWRFITAVSVSDNSAIDSSVFREANRDRMARAFHRFLLKTNGDDLPPGDYEIWYKKFSRDNKVDNQSNGKVSIADSSITLSDQTDPESPFTYPSGTKFFDDRPNEGIKNNKNISKDQQGDKMTMGIESVSLTPSYDEYDNLLWDYTFRVSDMFAWDRSSDRMLEEFHKFLRISPEDQQNLIPPGDQECQLEFPFTYPDAKGFFEDQTEYISEYQSPDRFDDKWCHLSRSTRRLIDQYVKQAVEKHWQAGREQIHELIDSSIEAIDSFANDTFVGWLNELDTVDQPTDDPPDDGESPVARKIPDDHSVQDPNALSSLVELVREIKVNLDQSYKNAEFIHGTIFHPIKISHWFDCSLSKLIDNHIRLANYEVHENGYLLKLIGEDINDITTLIVDRKAHITTLTHNGIDITYALYQDKIERQLPDDKIIGNIVRLIFKIYMRMNRRYTNCETNHGFFSTTYDLEQMISFFDCSVADIRDNNVTCVTYDIASDGYSVIIYLINYDQVTLIVDNNMGLVNSVTYNNFDITDKFKDIDNMPVKPIPSSEVTNDLIDMTNDIRRILSDSMMQLIANICVNLGKKFKFNTIKLIAHESDVEKISEYLGCSVKKLHSEQIKSLTIVQLTLDKDLAISFTKGFQISLTFGSNVVVIDIYGNVSAIISVRVNGKDISYEIDDYRRKEVLSSSNLSGELEQLAYSTHDLLCYVSLVIKKVKESIKKNEIDLVPPFEPGAGVLLNKWTGNTLRLYLDIGSNLYNDCDLALSIFLDSVFPSDPKLRLEIDVGINKVIVDMRHPEYKPTIKFIDINNSTALYQGCLDDITDNQLDKFLSEYSDD